MGVKLLGIWYATHLGKPYTTFACGYSNVNTIVKQTLEEAMANEVNLEEIIIGDISTDGNVAETLDWFSKRIPVLLVDHHQSATWMNKYRWAEVHEEVNGIPRCGTWQLAAHPKFKGIADSYSVLVEAIDAWDTWKWKADNNQIPRQLNALHTILGGDGFTQYCIQLGAVTAPEQLFNGDAMAMLKAFDLLLKRQVDSAERSMYTFSLWIQYNGDEYKYRAAIVFSNQNISEVAEALLDKHPEIDILCLASLPISLSWRTAKDLDVPLGVIAKAATGFGGGHPKSSGSTVKVAQFKQWLINFMDSNFMPNLSYSNLLSPYERRTQ